MLADWWADTDSEVSSMGTQLLREDTPLFARVVGAGGGRAAPRGGGVGYSTLMFTCITNQLFVVLVQYHIIIII